MKINQIAVIVSNKKGDVFEVELSKSERDHLISLLVELHNGKINCNKTKLENIELTN